MIVLAEYLDRSGSSLFGRWVAGVDDIARSEIAIKLDRLSRGNLSSLKSVGQGVQEIRSAFGPGYRIYCGRDGETLVILLGGGTKKRQQTDIAAAQDIWQEYKRRKKKGDSHVIHIRS